MADMINFHLPSLPGGDSSNAEALKQIKSYLFQLTEQMRYYLNNIDTDNFTEEYNRRLSTMVQNDTQNSIKASVSEQKLKRMQSRLETEMQSSINRITGASGGFFKVIKSKYVNEQWTETEDADGIPSGWCIMNTPEKSTATKVWRFTAGGLMYNSGPGAYNFPTAGNTSIAIDMDGHINAKFIRGELGEFITIRGVTGEIGGWIIGTDNLYSDYGDYRTYIQTPTSSKQWAFSTQKKENGAYHGTFIVKADGTLNVTNLRDMSDRSVIAFDGTSSYLVLGAGFYENNIDTYLEGNSIYLRYKGDSAYTNSVYIQRDSTTRFRLGYIKYSSDVILDTFESSGNMRIAANSGSGTIELNQSVLQINPSVSSAQVTMCGLRVLDVNSSGQLVIGLGQYGNQNDTYLEGNSVIVMHKSSFKIRENGTERFSFETDTYAYSGIDTAAVSRDMIRTSRGFVLQAGNANNYNIIMAANYVHIWGNLNITGATYLPWTGKAVPATISSGTQLTLLCVDNNKKLCAFNWTM